MYTIIFHNMKLLNSIINIKTIYPDIPTGFRFLNGYITLVILFQVKRAITHSCSINWLREERTFIPSREQMRRILRENIK